MKFHFAYLIVAIYCHNICENRNECPSCDNELNNITTYTDFMIQHDLFHKITQQFETPIVQSYITLNYLCCHTHHEIKIIQQIIRNLKWRSINITINDVGCNVDHNNSLINLYLMLDNVSQNKLLDLAEEIEDLMRRNNVTINNSRFRYGPLFHITIGQVSKDRDIMSFINKFDNINFELQLYTLFLSHPFTTSVSYD